MNLICAKCNKIQDLEQSPDTGECECGGMTYQEGEIFQDFNEKRASDLMQETVIKLRFLKNKSEDLN